AAASSPSRWRSWKTSPPKPGRVARRSSPMGTSTVSRTGSTTVSEPTVTPSQPPPRPGVAAAATATAGRRPERGQTLAPRGSRDRSGHSRAAPCPPADDRADRRSRRDGLSLPGRRELSMVAADPEPADDLPARGDRGRGDRRRHRGAGRRRSCSSSRCTGDARQRVAGGRSAGPDRERDGSSTGPRVSWRVHAWGPASPRAHAVGHPSPRARASATPHPRIETRRIPLLSVLGTGAVFALTWLPVAAPLRAALVLASGLPMLAHATQALARRRRVDGQLLDASTFGLLVLRG